MILTSQLEKNILIILMNYSHHPQTRTITPGGGGGASA